MKQLFRFLSFSFMLIFCMSTVQTIQLINPETERRQANLIDASLFTITAQVVNEYFLKNSHNFTTLQSMYYGIGSWLAGEVTETIYKKIYKIITKKNLRQTLGKTVLFAGIEIDHQRLVRRLVTTIELCIFLYIFNT